MKYYDLLDVPPEATPEQIKAAYRIQVHLHHPDRLLQVNPAVRQYAEERLKKINEAYAVLNDPEQRARYDASLRRRGRSERVEVEDREATMRAWGTRRAHTAARRAYDDFMRQAREQAAEARAAEQRRRRAEADELERRESEARARRAAAEAYPRLRAQGDEIILTLAPGVWLPLVRIPAGEFRQGSDPARDPLAGRDDQPQHKVFLSEACLARHPLTNAQYLAYAQAAGLRVNGALWRPPAARETHPVTGVTWDDALAFCRWLSKVTGRNFRLPTESEWEKAARGPDARLYPWGNAWDPARLNAGGTRGETTPVGQFSPQGDSPYGLADMSGNVWEWCADWHDPRIYARRAGRAAHDPQGPATGRGYVARGGAFDASARHARCAHRNWFYPHTAQANLGFRLCLGI